MSITSKAARCVLGGVLAASMAMPALAFAADDDDGGVKLRTVLTQKGSHLGWNGFTVTGEDGESIEANAVIDGDRGIYYQIDSAADEDGNAHMSATGVGFDVEGGKPVGIDGAFSEAPKVTDRVFYEGLTRGGTYVVDGTLHVHAAQAFSNEKLDGSAADDETGSDIPDLTADDVEGDYSRDWGILLGIEDGVLSVYDSEDGKVYELSYECVSPEKAASELTDADFARKVVETDREVTLDADGVPTDAVRTMSDFKPADSVGYVDVEFDVDVTGVYGWSLVAFETLSEYHEGGAAVPEPPAEDVDDDMTAVGHEEPYTVEVEGDNPWDVLEGSVIYHDEKTVQVTSVDIADGVTTYGLEPIEIPEADMQLGAVVDIDGTEYTLVRIDMLAADDVEGEGGIEGAEDGNEGAEVDDVDPGFGSDQSYGFVYRSADGDEVVKSEPVTPVIRNDFAVAASESDANHDYSGDDMGISDGLEVVAVHDDITDPDQTVSFISFEVYDAQAPAIDQIAQEAANADKLPQTGTFAVAVLAALLAAGGAFAGWKLYQSRTVTAAAGSAASTVREVLTGGDKD